MSIIFGNLSNFSRKDHHPSETEMALTTTSLDIPLVAKGKVRDIYALPSSPSTLLFIATDRVLSLLLPALTADFRLRHHSHKRTPPHSLSRVGGGSRIVAYNRGSQKRAKF